MNKNAYLTSIYLITAMAVLGLSSTSPAFTLIADEFDVTAKSIGLILAFFTLPGVVLTPILGVLADKYGRKVIVVPALLLFGVAGSLVGFASTFEELLFWNFLQGVGAAPLGALNATLISDKFKGKELARYMGFNNGILNISTALLPLLGGYLAVYGWNFPFFMPIVAVPIAIFVYFKLDDSKQNDPGTLKDYFVAIPRTLNNKKMLVLNFISLISFVLLFGPFLNYLPFLLVVKFETDSNIIGIVFFAMSLSSALFSYLLEHLVKIISERRLLIISFVIYTIALLGMILSPSLELVFVSVVLFGMAQGINIPNVLTLIASSSNEKNLGFIFSFNRTLALLGQALAPLGFALIFDFADIEGVIFGSAIISIFMVLFVILAIKKE